jgi:hypothetical protein
LATKSSKLFFGSMKLHSLTHQAFCCCPSSKNFSPTRISSKFASSPSSSTTFQRFSQILTRSSPILYLHKPIRFTTNDICPTNNFKWIFQFTQHNELSIFTFTTSQQSLNTCNFRRTSQKSNLISHMISLNGNSLIKQIGGDDFMKKIAVLFAITRPWRLIRVACFV